MLLPVQTKSGLQKNHELLKNWLEDGSQNQQNDPLEDLQRVKHLKF